MILKKQRHSDIFLHFFKQVRVLAYSEILRPPGEEKYIASIDLGSHTARFLICKIVGPPVLFRPVARKRFYTNLAEGFNQEDTGCISASSVERAVNALENFNSIAEEYSVDRIVGAATGIFRRAENSQDLLNKIKARTGVKIEIVSGEDEADLTLKGISHALGLTDYPDAFFDLGGSTTEIIYKSGDKKEIFSLPVGAFILTDMFFRNDPPAEEEVDNFKKNVDDTLIGKPGVNIKNNSGFKLIGSGGTVTSLAAMILNLDKEHVTPEAINGILIDRGKIHELYEYLKPLSHAERLNIKSIDDGRRKVILAGTICVMSIMEFFKSKNLTVSYSDILEGLIISYLKGEKDE